MEKDSISWPDFWLLMSKGGDATGARTPPSLKQMTKKLSMHNSIGLDAQIQPVSPGRLVKSGAANELWSEEKRKQGCNDDGPRAAFASASAGAKEVENTACMSWKDSGIAAPGAAQMGPPQHAPPGSIRIVKSGGGTAETSQVAAELATRQDCEPATKDDVRALYKMQQQMHQTMQQHMQEQRKQMQQQEERLCDLQQMIRDVHARQCVDSCTMQQTQGESGSGQLSGMDAYLRNVRMHICTHAHMHGHL